MRVGHTHDDIDAVIGNVVSYIRGLDIASFAEFQDACMDAITKDGGAVLGIRRLVGIADYKSIFSDCMKTLDVQGINVSYLILHKIILLLMLVCSQFLLFASLQSLMDQALTYITKIILWQRDGIRDLCNQETVLHVLLHLNPTEVIKEVLWL